MKKLKDKIYKSFILISTLIVTLGSASLLIKGVRVQVLKPILANKELNPRTHPALRIVKWAETLIPKKSATLVFQQSPFAYYSSHPFVSCRDPRLFPFYKQSDPDKAMAFLEELSIDFLYIPHFKEASFYNSVASDIVGRPDLARLIAYHDGARLYSLRTAASFQSSALNDINNSLKEKSWQKPKAISHRVKGLGEAFSKSYPDGSMQANHPSGIHPNGKPRSYISFPRQGPAKKSGLTLFEVDISGNAEATLTLKLYSPGQKKARENQHLWNGVLNNRQRQIQAQAWLDEGCDYQIVLKLEGRGELKAHGIRWAPIDPPYPKPVCQEPK